MWLLAVSFFSVAKHQRGGMELSWILIMLHCTVVSNTLLFKIDLNYFNEILSRLIFLLAYLVAACSVLWLDWNPMSGNRHFSGFFFRLASNQSCNALQFFPSSLPPFSISDIVLDDCMCHARLNLTSSGGWRPGCGGCGLGWGLPFPDKSSLSP